MAPVAKNAKSPCHTCMQLHHFWTLLGSHSGIVFGPAESNTTRSPDDVVHIVEMPRTGAIPVSLTSDPTDAMASSPLSPTGTYSPLVPKLPRPSPPSPCSSLRRSARWPRSARARATPSSSSTAAATEEQKERKRCLRCGGVYRDEENHPIACAFHGHVTGIPSSSVCSSSTAPASGLRRASATLLTKYLPSPRSYLFGLHT